MNERIQRRVSATEGLAFNTLKTLITWGDDFKIDAGRLDQEHQKIFRLALEASGLSRDAADADRLAVVLDEFGNAIKEHFAYEESVLGGIGHPTLDAHRAEHAGMLAEFELLRTRLADDTGAWVSDRTALSILNFMIGVTVGHILHTDKNFAS
ncbi:hemerythrin family protein [Accumulibacter sp.]|uniref:bacteriohemerythrin n=1 Tax=Accumulibacter sp. TaxID=2053492 RepID=UPI001A4C3164|nr:hemerythrin family protein [Accumulibacter sp.]MBL8373064.1 hemerythrin family protein [Accumulibacter sp.]